MLGAADIDLVYIVLFVEDFKLLVIAEPFLNGLTPPTSSFSIEGNGLFRAEPFFTNLTSPTSSFSIEGNGLVCIVLRTEAEWGTKEEQPSSVGGRDVALFEDSNCMVIANPSLLDLTSISSSSLTEGNPLVTAKPFLLGSSFFLLLSWIEVSSSLLALLRRGLVCSLSFFSPSGSAFRLLYIIAFLIFEKLENCIFIDETVSSQRDSTG